MKGLVTLRNNKTKILLIPARMIVQAGVSLLQTCQVLKTWQVLRYRAFPPHANLKMVAASTGLN
ncbi:MAG TPA: hypothetical protein VIJ75_13800 [Hanamia sp.]